MNEPVGLLAHGVGLRRGGRTVLEGVSLTLGPGVWALRGRNGSGKSSLLRVLAGTLPVATGRIEICGHDLFAQGEKARHYIGYVPDGTDLFGHLVAREFLEIVSALKRTSHAPALELFAELVSPAALDQRVRELSAGQRQKLSLCAALCGHPRVLLLDEPASALDDRTTAWLAETLTERASQGCTIVVAVHANPLGEIYRGTIDVSSGTAVLRATSAVDGRA